MNDPEKLRSPNEDISFCPSDHPKSYYEDPSHFLRAAQEEIKQTEVILDIGCGIRPVQYFQPKIHFMMDLWTEYTDILSYQYASEKNAFVLKAKALEGLKMFGDAAVDSVFLIDVIEHMEKEEGFQVLKEVGLLES